MTTTIPKNPLKIFHLKVNNPLKPKENYHVTFAAKVVTSPKTPNFLLNIKKEIFNPPEVQIGVAFCSPTDRFSKTLGRQKAIGRCAKRLYYDNFTGHSRDTIKTLWNNGRIDRPTALRHYKLMYLPSGLTFVKEL